MAGGERMSEIELKPCPFCGGEASIHEIKEDFLGLGWKIKGYAIFCKSCRASTEYDTNRNKVTEKWNRRTQKDGG